MTKPRLVRAILIDPFAGTVTEIQHDASDYHNIYPVISHETMPVDTFTACHPETLKGRDALFVDDISLLKPCHRFFEIEGHEQPLAGKGLILGADAAGQTSAAVTPLRFIRVTFLEHFGGGFFIPIGTPARWH